MSRHAGGEGTDRPTGESGRHDEAEPTPGESGPPGEAEPTLGDHELERAEVDVLAERWSAAWAGAGGFAACCTASVSYEDPLAIRPLLGLDPLERHAAALRVAFPDVHVERTAPALQRGDHACIPWRLIGTHLGSLATLPATEQRLTLHGLHYLELTDGRIGRARGFFDLYDASTQLGLLPARGGLGEAALLMLQGFGMRRQSKG